MRVLITGAAGRLGRRLTGVLEGRHDLVLGDVAHLDDSRFVRTDVTDAETVRAGMQGCDGVVHMAILDWPACSSEKALDYTAAAIEVHAGGTHHVLQAAREARVRRIVHISSVSTVDGYPPETLVGSDTRPCSSGVYGMTKGFGEDICRMYHQNFGMPVAVLRLGNIYMPEAGGAWMGNIFVRDSEKQQALKQAPSRVHADDVTRAITLALEAPEPRYALVHIVGADSGDRWDLEAARRAYGWEPRYAFGPDGLPTTP